MKTITLFRPVNQHELKLIRENDMQAFPPRLPEQPIFYPVMNIDYARQISRDWNVPHYGEGYVLSFEVEADYVNQFERKVVGGPLHEEIWVPAEDLDTFNSKIQGKIEVVESYLAS